jgi:hypothetical protein
MKKINWDLSPGRNKKSIEHYATKPLTRGDFKKVCQRNKWWDKKFIEIDSGEKKGTNKKYYYKEKID